MSFAPSESLDAVKTVQRDSRVLKPIVGLVALLVILDISCVLWGVTEAFVRPPDYAEGCILFNASRILEIGSGGVALRHLRAALGGTDG